MTGAVPEAGARWYRPRSLRGQIVLWLAPWILAGAVVAGGAFWASYSALIHTFMQYQMEILARSHLAGGTALAGPPGGSGGSGVPVDVVEPLPMLNRTNIVEWGAFVVQVWSADGRLLATSGPDIGVPLQAAPGHQRVRTSDAWAPGWRAYTTSVAGPHQHRVQVLQSEQFLQEEVAVRTLYAIVPLALLVPALLFTLWRVVGRASRSLRTVADEVAQRNDRSLGAIPMGRVPEEIVPLVGSFNALLERLDEAFAAQRRFVQDAAHELRTPMAAMALQMENLQPFVPPGEAQQQFAQLDAGMRRARHLVGQLLRLSRQEAPVSSQPPTAPVDITALLRDSVGQLMPLADRRRIEVGFVGAVQVAVNAAPSELRSVFDNLLDNALRYTPEGGAVEVRLHRLDGGAVVDIMDTGPGIPPELLERVFDRFFRVPGTAADGSGLGLAITRAASLRQGLRVELRARDDGAAGLVARVHLLAHSAVSRG